jgi:hypothetical protein
MQGIRFVGTLPVISFTNLGGQNWGAARKQSQDANLSASTIIRMERQHPSFKIALQTKGFHHPLPYQQLDRVLLSVSNSATKEKK